LGRESFASADDQTAAAARREEEMPKVEVRRSFSATCSQSNAISNKENKKDEVS